MQFTYEVLAEETKQILEQFLRMKHISGRSITSIRRDGGALLVNGEKAGLKRKVQKGDVVTVIFPKGRVSDRVSPVSMDLDIVYEDEYLMVIDKKENIAVLSRGEKIGLDSGILAYFLESEQDATIHFVNRLDYGTSGLLAVAKHKHIHHVMTMDMTEMKREYYALVEGQLYESGVIDTPIREPFPGEIKRTTHPDGKEAKTYYEVVSQMGQYTLITCRLATGRTHQIRVHLSSIGHPVVSDPLYGHGTKTDAQLLHSYYLSFSHPISGEKCTFQTDIPKRFTKEGNKS